jgi:hypothetical protein
MERADARRQPQRAPQNTAAGSVGSATATATTSNGDGIVTGEGDDVRDPVGDALLVVALLLLVAIAFLLHRRLNSDS